MLYWNTVNDLLKSSLAALMNAEELREFRLVGGTALSLHLGHRMSVDIDLFTDASYGSIDFGIIESFLKNSFDFVSGNFGDNPAFGKSYLIGNSPNEIIKLDIYYSMDPFIDPYIVKDDIRLASLNDIVGMKLDVIQNGGRKKDFWDLHELLRTYDINHMLEIHKRRSEWTHDAAKIIKNLTDFEEADLDPNPHCLFGKDWDLIKEDIEEAINERF
jgi:hypothetical protein